MNIIRVKAFPESRKPTVEETGEKTLRVFVREPAEDNRANRAIIHAVSVYYDIPENKLRMISGHRGMNKMIQVLP